MPKNNKKKENKDVKDPQKLKVLFVVKSLKAL
jgi:hypothetical protein